MKMRFALMLSILMVFSLLGCADANETADGETPADETEADLASESEDGAEEEEEAPLQEETSSGELVPDTNVSVYPNARLVYREESQLAYATSDSSEKVNDYYREHDGISVAPGSGSVEGNYGFLTPLVSILQRSATTDEEVYEEVQAEMSAYLEESGRLISFIILGESVEAQYKENALGSILSEVPQDETIIVYSIFTSD